MDAKRAATKRSRLTPEVRRDRIVEAAVEILLRQGHLPLPMDALAQAAGVSKALIYNYFHNQPALFNAILEREFRALAARGVVEVSGASNLAEAALGCAMLYFEHVATAGPLIHLILRDPYMTGRLQPGLAGFRYRIVLRLARLARARSRLAAKENIAAISLITTIPEEAGRLVHAGELALDRGRALCRQLMISSLEAIMLPAE
jgi:AcrR family transcriptional regulator